MVSLEAAVLAVALSAGGPTVLYDFCADWCGPCRAMAPTVEALAARGYPVQKVNVDEHPELVRKFGVGPIPCFVMVVDGREVERVVGATSYDHLERLCRMGRRSGDSDVIALASSRGGTAAASTPRGPIRPGLGAEPRRPHLALTEAPRFQPVTAPTSQPATPASPPVALASAPAAPASQPEPPAWGPRNDGVAARDEDLIAATVRLRVSDPKGHSWGSGTIIDARQGEALLLTCGHVFRDSQGRGAIEVDLFGAQAGKRVSGHLIGYDLERDVALVSIRIPGPVQVARLAPPDYVLRPGDPVVTVGCSHGDDPTVSHTRISSVDRYLGPPNVQVAGEPVDGRSGGGLFSRDGLVIGVCRGAEPQDREGFFAALGSIQAYVEHKGLTHVCFGPAPTPGEGPGTGPAVASALSGTGAIQSKQGLAVGRTSGPSVALDGPEVRPTRASGAVGGESATLSRAEQAALDEIRRNLDDGAEVVCVIRSRTDPHARSQIIMLDHVSDAFLDALAAEARSRSSGTSASLTASRPAAPASRATSPGPPRTLPPIEPTSSQLRNATSQWSPSEGRWSPRPRVVPVRPPVESQAAN